MSKSIYEEAIEIVAAALDLPDRSVTFKHTSLNVIKKALKQAQKQEKLLELYRELRTVKDAMLACCENVYDEYYDIRKKETDLEKQIRELENE